MISGGVVQVDNSVMLFYNFFSVFHQIFFQVLIILTGNYNFFNLLAIALLFPILDDEHLITILPSWLGEESGIYLYFIIPCKIQ